MTFDRCDQCNRDMPLGEGALSEGFHVECRPGVNVSTYGTVNGSWHFCSWSCMADYATECRSR